VTPSRQPASAPAIIARQASALLARDGAGLAVIMFVLAAFGGAGFADPGAQCSDIARESAATRHDTGREAAHVGTIHVGFASVDCASVKPASGSYSP